MASARLALGPFLFSTKPTPQSCSGEQPGSGWREGDESPRSVQREPTALDRKCEARAVLGRAAAVTE
jgi:hypothetical protein